MNRYEHDVLNALFEKGFSDQRSLAFHCGHSLGAVNTALRCLKETGYITRDCILTERAFELLRSRRPESAVILAAGAGLRMIPINSELPKALLEIQGESLIERIIRQLHEVGVFDISVVVGFRKESFEYLIDDYGVKLLVNTEYKTKNNLHSLRLAAASLQNTYIIPADLWCAENPFRRSELYSWYMVSEAASKESDLRIGRSLDLKVTEPGLGCRMVGLCYLTGPESAAVRDRVEALCSDPRYDGCYWETALYDGAHFSVPARVVPDEKFIELNTYEQLRSLDSSSPNLRSDILDLISAELHVPLSDISDITVLKKGMTNRSFLFMCRGERYIMRVPGEGTDRLIDRAHEAEVYSSIASSGFPDEVVYIDPATGCKITKYITGARVCDPFCEDDTKKCMRLLRQFHGHAFRVEHRFDLFDTIDFYESLWAGAPSVFRDYCSVKRDVFSLRPYIEAHAGPEVLTHIDAVPDNFLIYNDCGEEKIRLIDWEYAGMQDPHVDIAMFCIYSSYDREHVEKLIDQYFSEGCPPETRVKIYCYISVCGLLWSNWCEYKRNLGVEFGEYSLTQYRFAKEYYHIAVNEIKRPEMK